MKTSINWLLDELKKLSESGLQHSDFKSYMHKQDILINNAKEKEKEQIIEAYEYGKQNGIESSTNVNSYIIGEYYYNKTFNQNK